MAEGYDPDTILIFRHAESDTDCLSAKIGVAAKLTVDEHNGTRLALWKPLPRSAVASGIAPNGLAAST